MFSNRPDFRNSTAQSLRKKSRSLNKFIRKYLSYRDCNASEVPSRIKDLINLVQYWHEEFVPTSSDGRDRALIDIQRATLEAWRKYSSPKTINMAIAFRAVMEELQNHYPNYGASSTAYMTLLRKAVMETLQTPLFVDVSVTKNWCKMPTVKEVKKSTPQELLIATGSVNKDFRDIPASQKATINTFITNKLQPDDSFSRPIHNALDNLCRHLEEKLTDVDRVIKSGSMGKGTALKGKSDLDCVMILNEIQGVEDLKRKVKPLKEELVRILKMEGTNIMPDWKINVHGTTPFCVQFSMNSRSPKKTTVDVDLLPTFDKNTLGLEKLYQQMGDKDEHTRRFYSAALTELQIEFVKPKPGRVKDLIRLVKYWCKEFVVQRGGGVYPSSYLIELVTIHAWEESGKPVTFDMAVGFRAVMEKLLLHEKLDIVWYNNYEASQVIRKRAPRVIDPANPFNNVYDIVTEWLIVTKVVKETLKKPFLKGTKVTYRWK